MISSRLLIISGFSTSQSFHLPHALIHTHTSLLTLHASNKLDFATSSTMNHDLSYTFSRTLNHDLSFTLYEQSHPTTQWMLKPSWATQTAVTYHALETQLIIISIPASSILLARQKIRFLDLSSFAVINALTIIAIIPMSSQSSTENKNSFNFYFTYTQTKKKKRTEKRIKKLISMM